MCITKQQGPSCRFSNCVTIKKQNPRHLPFCMLGISSVDSTAKVSNFVVICMRRAETHLREWYVFNTTNPTGIYQRNRHPLIISTSAFPSKIKQSLALDASPQVQSLNELTEYQINFSLIVRTNFVDNIQFTLIITSGKLILETGLEEIEQCFKQERRWTERSFFLYSVMNISSEQT